MKAAQVVYFWYKNHVQCSVNSGHTFFQHKSKNNSLQSLDIYMVIDGCWEGMKWRRPLQWWEEVEGGKKWGSQREPSYIRDKIQTAIGMTWVCMRASACCVNCVRGRRWLGGYSECHTIFGLVLLVLVKTVHALPFNCRLWLELLKHLFEYNSVQCAIKKKIPRFCFHFSHCPWFPSWY